MVPAYLVIGDSLPVRANNVVSGRTGEPLDEAVVTYRLIDAENRELVVDGELDLYDEDTASFETIIGADDLGLYDEEDNPSGLIPNRNYALRVTVDFDDVKTTRTLVMVALLEPPTE